VKSFGEKKEEAGDNSAWEGELPGLARHAITCARKGWTKRDRVTPRGVAIVKVKRASFERGTWQKKKEGCRIGNPEKTVKSIEGEKEEECASLGAAKQVGEKRKKGKEKDCDQ